MSPQVWLATIAVAAAFACGAQADAQVGVDRGARPPVYQRQRFDRRPVYPHQQRFRVPYRAPSVGSGTFQRPYPYHLDYYRQRYGGGYEPYFGNLYGPPRVVGAQPFAASAYPGTQQYPLQYAQPIPQQQPVQQEAPIPPARQTNRPEAAAAPMIVCPHCGEKAPLLWQPPTKPSGRGSESL